MAKASKSRSPLFYAQRIVDDKEVQDQLRTAAARLREAYLRTIRQPGRAAEDKKVYANLREAATSIRNSLDRVRAEPEPSHRGRRIIVALACAGGALALAQKAQSRAGSG